jgi:hypothetical protein
VYLSFAGYKGNYYIDKYSAPAPHFYPPKNNKDTLLLLTEGDHWIWLDGAVFSAISFHVDGAGKVSNIDKPDAAYIDKDRTRVVFKTAQVTIDSKGVVYDFSAFNNDPHPNFVGGKKLITYTLVKGLAYFIAVDFGGFYIYDTTTGRFYIPTMFEFKVDAKGNVSPYDTSVTSLIAACYKKNVVTLNTVAVTIDPKLFHTDSIKLSYETTYFKTTRTLYLIKGMGVYFRYKEKDVEKLYHMFPM